MLAEMSPSSNGCLIGLQENGVFAKFGSLAVLAT
jgi:hypothetical protein